MLEIVNLIYCENGWYDTGKDQSEYYDNAYLVSDKKELSGDTLFYDRKIGFGKAIGKVEIVDTAEKYYHLWPSSRNV